MQSVGQLDENHPHIIAHGMDGLAEVFRLAQLAHAVFGDAMDFGYAVHQPCDFRAEFILQGRKFGAGIFHHVMQKPCNHCWHIQTERGKDGCDSHDMHKIWLT